MSVLSAVGPMAPQRTRTPAVAEAGVLDWIDRVIALSGLGTGLAAILFATQQLGGLNWVWLALVAGGLLAASLLLPLYAWRGRDVKVPATLYASAVFFGLWTWSLAWVGGPPSDAPWLWPCIGVSTMVLSLAWGNTVAMVHNLFCSAAYLIARVSPAGGGVDGFVALQDTLVVAVQPALLLVLFSYIRNQAADVDVQVSEARRSEADANLRATLVGQRARLDAVIHDEVMTTLVAAARSTGHHDDHVTRLAEQAMASLEAQGSADENADPFPPNNVFRLLRDVVLSVHPGTELVDRVDPLAPPVPHAVVRALAQAAREAVLNAAKHADAGRIVVSVDITAEGNALHVVVEVADDGSGFDPDHVSSRRLGIRLSLRQRLRAVGGAAHISSRPGDGTTVRLEWSGAGERGTDAGGAADTGSVRQLPMMARLDLAPIAYVSGAAITLFSMVGVLEHRRVVHPELLWTALALVAVASTLVLSRFGQRLPRSRTVTVVVLTLAACVAGVLALPPASGSIHGTWFVGAACMLAVLVRAGGRQVAAWVLAVGSGAAILLSSLLGGAPVLMQVGAALNPLGWLVCVEMLIVWIRRIQRQIDAAQRAADEASADSASSFAALVVREVWLADVRDQVGGMLGRLADPAHAITEEDREACLALEGRLRDGIKAANFSAPALSAAIMEARLRGVQVTLVDNRGADLSEVVRRAMVRHLEGVVRNATNGRIVARTAPEGYDEAVTIVQVDASGSTLAKIDHDGMIEVTRS